MRSPVMFPDNWDECPGCERVVHAMDCNCGECCECGLIIVVSHLKVR